jgi:hypothetical protein
MRRQVGDEAHRVGQDDPGAARQPHPAQRRIERREQHVLGGHAGAGQPVEQGRLAGIGVADQRDDRQRHLLALGAVQRPRAAHRLPARAPALDLVLQDAPVGLDLGFARAAEEAGAAALALQVRPGPHQPAALIVQMRQLDLQRAFLGLRAPAEDFQDQPGPVEDLGVPFLFEVALLHRRQRVIDDDEPGFQRRDHPGDLLDLAAAQQGGRLRLRYRQDGAVGDFEIDRARQPLGFLQPLPALRRTFSVPCRAGPVPARSRSSARSRGPHPSSAVAWICLSTVCPECSVNRISPQRPRSRTC